MKRRRPSVGSIILIQLGDGTHVYARVLEDVRVAVYDLRTSEEVHDLKWVVSQPVLFTVHTWDASMKDGRWPAVGRIPLRADEFDPRHFMQFIQDVINPERCQIIDYDGAVRDATVEECVGLESASVWAPEHVERRIADHYAGRPNVDLAANQLLQPGQVFSIVLDRDDGPDGEWTVSGRVWGTIKRGDRVAVGSATGPTLLVSEIMTYMQDGTLQILPAGQSGTLRLAGPSAPELRIARALFKPRGDAQCAT